MAGQLGKRKRSRAEDEDEDGDGEEGLAHLKRRRDGQQPTPPDSASEGHSGPPSRNLTAFKIASIPSFLDPHVHANDEDEGGIEAGLDLTAPALLAPPPPTKPPSSAYESYDKEFGERVCKRFAQIRQARERKYGVAIAAAFAPGQTPLRAREAEEMAQMKLKAQSMEDDDVGDGQSPCGDDDEECGEKACEGFAQIRQARERKYGVAIAAAFAPGQTPLRAREAEEMAQMELKGQSMEDNDIGDGHSSSATSPFKKQQKKAQKKQLQRQKEHQQQQQQQQQQKEKKKKKSTKRKTKEQKTKERKLQLSLSPTMCTVSF
ncbi:hypothetical protein B0A55_10764 [Friedmanniomyces simplex]|uniref:Uncharacterized protein n=1 Tax=Friedmanniomyces simplex TaxID=329884 RepID=A0A4U0X3Q8_9PEZI|nr:hypothetical protein B0A55_10764 [Friedmanniomyces simplex]